MLVSPGYHLKPMWTTATSWEVPKERLDFFSAQNLGWSLHSLAILFTLLVSVEIGCYLFSMLSKPTHICRYWSVIIHTYRVQIRAVHVLGPVEIHVKSLSFRTALLTEGYMQISHYYESWWWNIFCGIACNLHTSEVGITEQPTHLNSHFFTLIIPLLETL